MGLNKKGQAAITDALYFLMIVSGLSVFLFAFSMGYGTIITEDLERQYGTEFASSAFKTILYSSTPRIEGKALEDAREVDYLMAAVKEDFADNGDLDRTSGVLANNVVGIMEPLQDNFDYVFFIYVPETEGFPGFPALMFHLHKRTFIDTDRRVDPAYTSGSEIWICKPKDVVHPPSAHETMTQLELLLTQLGSISMTTIPTRLEMLEDKIPDPGGFSETITTVKGRVGLAMWVSTGFSPGAQGNFNSLNCTVCWENTAASVGWVEKNLGHDNCPH